MSEFDSRLIDLVRSNPSLYEREMRTAPYEGQRKRKTELWASIATSLSSDAHTCLTRWNNLSDKWRREWAKEKAGGVGSDWSLLPKLSFLSSCSHHNNKAKWQQQQQQQTLSSELLIEEIHDEDDPLQEAMDEQQVAATAAAAANTPTPTPPTQPVSAELLKRIEALLEGLGAANRHKAEKRILAYLCKCNLKALNEEQIDDVVI